MGNGNDKTFTIIYVVMEKVWSCSQYSPDGKTLFNVETIEFNNKPAIKDMKWTTSYVDDNCNGRAHIVSPKLIALTWDTSDAAANQTLIALRRNSGALHGTPLP